MKLEVRSALAAFLLALAACAEGSTSSTDDLNIHSDAAICDLNTVIDGKQGVITGRVVQVDDGFPGGLPWDVPGREYALAMVEVDQALPPLLDLGSEAVFEPLVPGTTLQLVVYPDYEGTPLDEIQQLASGKESAVLLLVALRNWDQPELPGMWGLARAIDVAEDRAVFLGQCADIVNQDFVSLADALDRPPDEALVVDFAAETLATQDTPLAPGPIETKLLDLRGMLPLPTLLPDLPTDETASTVESGQP